MIKIREHFNPWITLIFRPDTLNPITQICKRKYLIKIDGEMIPQYIDGEINPFIIKAIDGEMFLAKLSGQYD